MTTASILLTGFLPFLHFSFNPSEWVARKLNGTSILPRRNGTLPEYVLSADVLPVSEDGVSKLNRTAYAAIFHLGYESHAKGLKVEIAAENVKAHEDAIEDVKEDAVAVKNSSEVEKTSVAAPERLGSTTPRRSNIARTESSPIFVNGPDILPTTINLAQFDFGDFSRDAGQYFCNEIYYRSLYAERVLLERKKNYPYRPVVFIHLPPVDRVPLADQAVAVGEIVAAVMSAARGGTGIPAPDGHSWDGQHGGRTEEDVGEIFG